MLCSVNKNWRHHIFKTIICTWNLVLNVYLQVIYSPPDIYATGDVYMCFLGLPTVETIIIVAQGLMPSTKHKDKVE